MISIASLIDVQRKKSVYAVTVYMPKSKTILDCIMSIISVKGATHLLFGIILLEIFWD